MNDRRRLRTSPRTRAVLAALGLAVLVPAACGGPRSDDGGGHGPADVAGRAAEHLRAAEATEFQADARCSEGDRLLKEGRLEEAKQAFLGAGRLYESAARERNRAYDDADAARASGRAASAR